MQEKFYAKFKGTFSNEIEVFNTKRERDDWVNFRDGLSRDLGETKENCIFERQTLSKLYAERKIRKALHKVLVNDEFNKNHKWYLLGGDL